MAATLITVATDGFRDYVGLPDGRQLNLGSVSVLKLVTTLVSSSTDCRKALDGFLSKGSTTIKVDLQALEGLLRPRRARWAGHGDPFIPADSRQHFRGASMNPVQAIYTHIDEIERHVAALQQEAGQGQEQQEKSAGLRKAVASLLSLVTQTEVEGLSAKLAAIETTIDAINKAGSAPKGSVETLRGLTASLCEVVTGKTAAVDEDAKRELELYMENESKLYRQKQDIIKNIMRKMKGGKYNHSLAPKLWMYWVDEGAKMYIREFGGDVKTMFPKQLREELAKEIANDQKKLIEDGEYDSLKVAAEQGQDEPEAQEGQAQEKQAQEQQAEKDQQEQAKQAQDQQQDQQGQDKEAALRISSDEVLVINEALAHSVMAKVESALKVVEASGLPGTQVAKKDLNTISIKLAKLVEASDLKNPSLRTDLTKLASMADKVHSHFAA